MKIIKSLAIIVAVAAVVGGGTVSYFSDEVEVEGNTFSTGSLDLKVDDSDVTLTNKFNAEGMVPGKSYDTGCVTLRNAGTVAGKLVVKVANLVSNENGLLAPEIADGDSSGVEVDPTGYDQNNGDGELWDQITFKMCVESGAGPHATNKKCDWDDTILKSFSSTQDDYSSYYSIKQNYDYADNKNIIIEPGEEKSFCTAVKFIDDQTNSWWGAQGSLTNNMAMSDDAQLDLIFGLVQVQ